MKWTVGLIGAGFVAASLGFAGPAIASPPTEPGTTQAAADASSGPGQIASTSPASVVLQQDSGDIKEGAGVNTNGTQGTFKTVAVDGQVDAKATQGTFKTSAIDGTETASVVAAPQRQ